MVYIDPKPEIRDTSRVSRNISLYSPNKGIYVRSGSIFNVFQFYTSAAKKGENLQSSTRVPSATLQSPVIRKTNSRKRLFDRLSNKSRDTHVHRRRKRRRLNDSSRAKERFSQKNEHFSSKELHSKFQKATSDRKIFSNPSPSWSTLHSSRPAEHPSFIKGDINIDPEKCRGFYSRGSITFVASTIDGEPSRINIEYDPEMSRQIRRIFRGRSWIYNKVAAKIRYFGYGNQNIFETDEYGG